MPASASRAESAQKGTPPTSSWPRCRCSAITTASSADVSNGPRLEGQADDRARSRSERLELGPHALEGLPRYRPALAEQPAVRGVARILLTALDHRGVERSGSEQPVAVTRSQTRVELCDPGEHRPHRRDRIDAEVGTGAVGRETSRLDLEGDEALVRDRDDLLRRLRNDRGIGRRAANECLRPDAADLLVGDGGHDHVATEAFPDRCGADEHRRRERCLHVACPAAVEAAVPYRRRERALHPGDTDRVHVGIQEQRAAAARSAGDADDVGTSRRGLVELDLEPGRTQPVGDKRCDLPLAGTTRDEIRVDRVDLDEPRGQRGELVARALRHRARRRPARRPGRRPCGSAPRATPHRRSLPPPSR